MDRLRDLPSVLEDFRTKVQRLAAHLEIESIEAEDDMTGEPDMTKMAIAVVLEELVNPVENRQLFRDSPS